MKISSFLYSTVTLVIAVGLLGCNSSAPTTDPPANAPAAAPGEGKSAAAQDNGQPDPAKLEVPASLKGDGFEYYGLSNTKPLKYKVSQGTGEPEEATSTFTLKSATAESAEFEAIRTGALATLGSSTITVKADGVYSDSIAGSKITPPQLEIPMEVKVGKTWDSKAKFDLNGQTVEINVKNSILSEQPVESGLGKHQAIRIKATGTAKIGEVIQQTDAMIYLVKGIGIVRLESTATSAGTTQKQTIVAIKD